MFVTHQPIAPRLKEWVPLATHQLRLRNLIQVLAFGIKHNKHTAISLKETSSGNNSCNKKESYYYTLHSTTMSAPFYTSEKVECDSPKWKEIELSSWTGNVSSSSNVLVIRIWIHHPDNPEDQVITVWGMYLSGLTYIGQHLNADTPTLKPNSVVLYISGGYFTDPDCLASEPKIRFSSISMNLCDARQSYTVNLLLRLHRLQQAIKKQVSAAEQLKQKISMGDYLKNETRGSIMLKRLLNKNKPKVSHQDIIRVKQNLELAKYRVQVLKEEKIVIKMRLETLKEQIETISDTNQLVESHIMEKYRLLMREMSAHREWRKGYVEKREEQLHSRAMLNFRTKQLISELHLIYPIIEKSPDKYTICDVHLPDSEDFAGHDEIQISVALGFVTHVTQMISIFLQVPLRYPVIHFGSRSRIVDQIAEKIPDSKREFPLYWRGRDKLEFHYAVYLLNKNIAQLRWLCGLPTQDLRNTLANLSSLVKMKHNSSNLDPNSSRSLSSSTAEICSSSFSVSSPFTSILSLTGKKGVQRVFEPNVPTQSELLEAPTFQTPIIAGHRASKSVGSAKDLMLSVFPSDGIDCTISKTEGLVNSLSFSLDKGLNKYEEDAVSPEQLVDGKPALNCFGSEPSLNASVKNHETVDVEKKITESEATQTFLKSWQAEKQSVPFSDDDSDVGNVFAGKASGSLTEEANLPRIASTTESNVEYLEKNNCPLSDSDSTPQKKVVVEAGTEGEVLCSETVNRRVETKSQKLDLTLDGNGPKKCDLQGDLDVKNSLCLKDALLESVTSRTEVLANQTTSFNRFKFKFKSNVEGSNK